jgi:CRP/FNR family cyclic AMP-dependent transcriptional regulator
LQGEFHVLNTDQIRKYPLFAGLSDLELAALAPCLTKRTFGQDAYLFYPGNPGLNLYLVESGLLRLFFADVQGQEYLLNVVGPLDCVGLPLLPDDQTRLVGLSALQQTVVLTFARDDVFAVMKRSPRFMENIYMEMSRNARKLTLYIQAHTILQLEGRLASLLVYLAMNCTDPAADGFPLPLNQGDIASWVGCSRGRINRALGKMRERNLVRLDDNRVIVLDLPGLVRMAGGLVTYWV